MRGCKWDISLGETRVRCSFVLICAHLYSSMLQWGGIYSPDVLAHAWFLFCLIWHTFQQLEKFVNLNYQAFEKLLKNHDKLLPSTPCHQFYMSKLRNQVVDLYIFLYLYIYVCIYIYIHVYMYNIFVRLCIYMYM